ncbi:MAG: hypothetical protein IBX44_03890 [Sulfurospirillum sp.]|nr:hypothetical protein [Sulfurospirillum sp.]
MAFRFNGLIQKYFTNIFVSVVRYANEWHLHSKVVKNGKILRKFSKSFPLQSNDTLSKELLDYLEELYNTHTYMYLSYLLDSMGQGAIFGTSAQDFENNSIDFKNIIPLTVEKKWSLYASFIDINWTKKIFEQAPIDFIYSPFILLYDFICTSKKSQQPIFYIFNHQDYVAMAVFADTTLLFASFFKTAIDEGLLGNEAVENWEEEEALDDTQKIIELSDEQEEAEDFESLESLDDLESFNALEGSHDLESAFESENDEDKETTMLGRFGEKNDNDIQIYGRDMYAYKYLLVSIKEYYKNRVYASDFIEKIVIYDGYELSRDFIDMIEKDLMMDVEIHKIDISQSVCDLAIKEIGL